MLTAEADLYRKGWLGRQKDGRAYLYAAERSRDDYAAGLLAEALSAAEDPAATLVRLVGDLEPDEVARLRAGGSAAAHRIERLINPPPRNSRARQAVTYVALATAATLAVAAIALAGVTIIHCPPTPYF
jgi:hypothetical protein